MAVEFPREGQGFRAEIIVGDNIHLVVMATHTGAGPVASIFDAKLKKWWPNREWSEDFDDAKKRAENLVRTWYRYVGSKTPLPAFEWKETG